MHVNKLVSMTEAFFFSTENVKIILHFLKRFFYSVFSRVNAQNPQSVTASTHIHKNYSHNPQRDKLKDWNTTPFAWYYCMLVASQIVKAVFQIQINMIRNPNFCHRCKLCWVKILVALYVALFIMEH